MQLRTIYILGGALAISGCANQFPGPNNFDGIVASYQTEIREVRVGAMKSEALSHERGSPAGRHEAAPNAMSRTRGMISRYRAANKAEEKRALVKQFNTLRVLEGMALIQTNKIDEAARMGKQVRESGLALGRDNITSVALMGISFPELISGWRDAEWFASSGPSTTAPRVTIAGSRQAVRRLIAAASCIDTLLDQVRGAPRTVKLSPSMVLWVVGAPPASGQGRDILLGNTDCRDEAIVDYVAKKRPVAQGTLAGDDVLYLAASAAIFRSWVAVVVAEGYCDRLSLAAAFNCRGQYVRPHLQAAAESMADFLTPGERATPYCSTAPRPGLNTRRGRFVLWYAWLRFNIENFDKRKTC